MCMIVKELGKVRDWHAEFQAFLDSQNEDDHENDENDEEDEELDVDAAYERYV